jgi:hypothetical protein
MNKFLTKAVIGGTLAATTLTAAMPADAQRYGGRGYRGYRHDGTGTAIVAGVAGLAIGAAIASSSNRDRYYDNRYYNDNYNNYPRYRYNGYNYYNDYPRYQSCRMERRWDPYYGRPVRVRVCY